MTTCGNCCAACAVVLAFLVGSIHSGLLVRMGAFQWIDTWDPAGRGLRWRGETPWITPKPWRFTAEDIPKLDDQVIIVTGANSGLGFWTASLLAGHGATVVLGCRSTNKCAIAASEIVASSCPLSECSRRVLPMALDLASFDSIVKFASDFKARHSRLDALVLNAGVLLQPWSRTEAGLESTMAINHVGHFLLAKSLLPILEATASKHGVATVSVHSSAAMYESVHDDGIQMEFLRPQSALEAPKWYDPWEAYCESKLANVLFAQELAKREKDAGHNVLVNSHAPGAVVTNLLDHVVGPNGTLEKNVGSTVRQAVYWLLTQLCWDPRDACLTQVFTAVSKEIRDGKATGKYFQSVAREQLPDTHAANVSLQKLLWDTTEALVDNLMTVNAQP